MSRKRARAVFVAKLTPSKTRQSGKRSYYVYRLLIPKKVAERLRLVPGDYLQVKVRKALWYDMVDWDRMPQTWMMLPEWMKRKVAQSRDLD